MELNVTVSILVLLPIALAFVAGGLVLYRGSTRVGWRAVGMGSVALGVGVLLVFTLTLPVATEGEAPEPVVVGEVVSAPPTDAPATSQQPSSLSSSGMMVPRPRSVDELVMRSDLIVVGIITAVVEERWISPYGDNEKVLPAGDDDMLVTDYEVQVESVLRGDGTVVDGGSVVLRMFGHLSNSSATITPNVFLLPNPGDYLLFALALIHRRTACRRPAEETKGCASESGIMVLKQKTGPRKGAPDRCYHVTTPTASKSPSTTTAWWPMPG